ncbi:hypothetical protein LG293_16590 (plasmid) [Citricoccus nitrophenolicus]
MTDLEHLLAKLSGTAPDEDNLDAAEGFTLHPTGTGPIDALLAALSLVAADEKPQDWGQSNSGRAYWFVEPCLPHVMVPEQLIQETADLAAEKYQRMQSTLLEVHKWIEATEAEAPSSVVARVGKLRSILATELDPTPPTEKKD